LVRLRAKKNELNNYVHQFALHPDVQKAIELIYEDLTDINLLKRCVGGYTQNDNESYSVTYGKLLRKSCTTELKLFLLQRI